jgi:hypothetical protein
MNATAAGANARGPEAGAWSERHGGVEGHTEQRDVERGCGDIFEAAKVGQVREGEGPCEHKVGLRTVFLFPCLGRCKAVSPSVIEWGLSVRTGAKGLQKDKRDCCEGRYHPKERLEEIRGLQSKIRWDSFT